MSFRTRLVLSVGAATTLTALIAHSSGQRDRVVAAGERLLQRVLPRTAAPQPLAPPPIAPDGPWDSQEDESTAWAEYSRAQAQWHRAKMDGEALATQHAASRLAAIREYSEAGWIGLVALPSSVTTVTLFLLLPHRGAVDTHTRCGHCGYILRGLTEPRCAECGKEI